MFPAKGLIRYRKYKRWRYDLPGNGWFHFADKEDSAVDRLGNDILEIKPESPHQRTALYVGSRPLVESIRKRLREKG